MSEQEISMAIFYNFKEEETCPMCRMVKNLYDKGGSELLFDRLGILENECHVHSFKWCFVHHKWIENVYRDERYQLPSDIVCDEALELFHQMKSLLRIT